MCENNRNFFELCNEILEELFFEPVETFDELHEITEGRRCKRELNRALNAIVGNEVDWNFRHIEMMLYPVDGIAEYDKPNGFIDFIKRDKSQLVLQYYEDHKYLPSESKGTPVGYWIEGNKIRLYPIPSGEQEPLIIHLYTHDYAIDCCGMGKPTMTNETDVPIIPNTHRDILVYRVCADWRANASDNQSAFYNTRYKEAYRRMLSDCRNSEDFPNGLNIGGYRLSQRDVMMGILRDPYSTPPTNRERNL